MTGMGKLREARQRRNVLSPKKMIKDLVVQTGKHLDYRERDTELTSITLSAGGSQSLAHSLLVHDACIVPPLLFYDLIRFFAPRDRFGTRLLNESVQVLALLQ